LSPDNDDKRKLEGEENDDYKPDNFSPHHHHRKLLCHDHEAFQASPHAKPQRRFFFFRRPLMSLTLVSLERFVLIVAE
jgi:hypothetical protein